MGEILATFHLVNKDTDWMDDAKCHENDGITWFPDKGQCKAVIEAKNYCSDCAAKQSCLTFALDNEILYGIWGGKSSAERKRILHSRKYKARMGL